MNATEEYLGTDAERKRDWREAVAGGNSLPAALEAEAGILACILIEPESCFPKVTERFGSDEVFYDLRHHVAYKALEAVWAAKGMVDEVTLAEELKSRGQLEQVGGHGWIGTLRDAAPTGTAMLPSYLDLVWEKFIARRLLVRNAEQGALVVQFGGASEAFVARVEEEHERWRALLDRGTMTPRNLREPAEFGDAYRAAWFGRKEETYGWRLPFKFPMRLRPAELTLMTGDNGSGKSSMLGLISVVVGKELKPGQRVVVASMEVPPEITLWIMARQVLGRGRIDNTAENVAQVDAALAWLNERILLYDFQGITDWRELLNTFRYAQEHKGAVLCIVDSVMRIGIPDDDYAQQGVVAAAFANFALKTGAHVILVVHENKGQGHGKERVRGSKQWTDNAANVVGMIRNEAKGARVEEWKEKLAAGEMEQSEFDGKLAEARKTWDAKFLLSKQRYPGSQQNGCRYLYFDHPSLQFHEQPGLAPYNFLMG